MGCVESRQTKSESAKLSKPHIFFVVGGPGSGKGTQCNFLVQQYKFKHLSTGDLLRYQKEKKGQLSQQIQKCMLQGKLVSSQLIVKLLKKAIIENGNRRYLIDGFPRNQQNWDQFQKVFKNNVVVRNLICFNCDKDIMMQRIMQRAKNSGRIDDKQETVKLRIQNYQKETIPIISKFNQMNNCIMLNANQQVNTVYEQLKIKLQQINVYPPQPASVFFLLGGPGSGKGTQSDLLVATYGFRHLSTGDLLRQQVKKQSPMAKQINQFIKQGKLVSSELLVNLMKNKIQANNYEGMYLLDGFPRNQQNIDAWNKIIGNNILLKGIIYFSCDKDILKQRLLQRGKTSGRVDDNEQTIIKRLTVFQQQTTPLLQQFKIQNKLFQFNANQSVTDIFGEVKQCLEDKLKIQPRIPMKAKVLLVMGGPGSGKGTQCNYIVEKFQFIHLSTGDLLRDQVKNQGLFAQFISEKMKLGQMVSSQILLDLVRKKIQSAGRKGIFLLDGFPRNQQNLIVWNFQFGIQLGFSNLIYFQCSQQQLQKRLLARAKDSGRSDDNPEIIKKRIQSFKKESYPVLQKFGSNPDFILNINASGSIEEVQELVYNKMKQKGY